MTDDVHNPLESWHLDKRVNVSIILMLAAQIAGGIWFASKMDSRLTSVEARTSIIEATRVGESLAALKTSQDDMRRALDRIERTIDGQRK
jgi:hypothetical protein